MPEIRSSDFRRGEENGRLDWASRVYNRHEAERAFSVWARRLNQLLSKPAAN